MAAGGRLWAGSYNVSSRMVLPASTKSYATKHYDRLEWRLKGVGVDPKPHDVCVWRLGVFGVVGNTE